MFYEFRHSAGADYFSIESGEDLAFPAHIHSSFELITLQSGSMKVFVGSREYILTPGRGVLIFPNQIHSLSTMRHSKHRLCIFSPRLVSAFSASREGMMPTEALFDMPTAAIEQLFALTPDSNANLIKGALYTVCGLMDEKTAYVKADVGDEKNLLYEIFAYIDAHLSEDCSLEALAASLSYSYTYLSKYFKQSVGQSYNSYVNQYRVREVCDRLCNTSDSILKISEECGFRSLRSMNRNFKEQTGVTPAQYRSDQKSGRLV